MPVGTHVIMPSFYVSFTLSLIIYPVFQLGDIVRGGVGLLVLSFKCIHVSYFM